MSETASPTQERTEQPLTPESKPARIKGAPEAFQLEHIDQMVGRAYVITSTDEYQALTDEAEKQDMLKKVLERTKADYLNHYGFDSENASDDEKKLIGSALDVAMYSSESSWIEKPEDDERPRNVVFDGIHDFYNGRSTEATNSKSKVDKKTDEQEGEKQNFEEDTEEFKAILEDVRKEYAAMLAERTKRSFEGAKRTGSIDELRERAADIVGAVATSMMLDLEEKGATPAQYTQEIEKFIGEQMDNLVAEIEAERAADYEKRRPFVKKLLDGWAGLGKGEGGMFSKERFKGTLIKGGIFAVPGVAAGVVIAPFVGAIAGSAAAGAAAAAGARAIGRHIAGARLDAAANARTIASTQADEMRGHIIDNQDASHVELLELFDTQTEAYRKRNQRRLLGGTAIAMTVGLVVGGTMAEAAHVGLFGKVGDTISDHFGNKGSSVDAVHGSVNGIPNGPDHTDVYHGSVNGIQGGPDHLASTGHETSSATDYLSGSKGTTEFDTAGVNDFNTWADGHTVKSGESVWKLSTDYLKSHGVKHPTKFQIDAVKDKMVPDWKAKGIVDARGWLRAGAIINSK